MKILIIVLLVAALGAGAYFYFGKKQPSSSQNSRELILGKWKIDSLVMKKTTDSLLQEEGLTFNLFDSGSLSKYQFEFKKDSSVLQTQDGKIEDSSRYEFADDKNLLIWSTNDTDKVKFAINRLDTSNLIIRDKDSAKFFFKKIQ
jgi:hypothetical protein